LTGDAACCPFCCCFCGGCCGKYEPCIHHVIPLNTSPGGERLQATFFLQCAAAAIMPFTLCGCCWACCGLCTSCTMCVAESARVNGVSKSQPRPETQIMSR
jgi:hypothetical protein